LKYLDVFHHGNICYIQNVMFVQLILSQDCQFCLAEIRLTLSFLDTDFHSFTRKSQCTQKENGHLVTLYIRCP